MPKRPARTVGTPRWSVMAAATACLVALAACATTQLKDQWRDPDYRAASAEKVLVIAVIGRPDRRRIAEDQFVARLRKANVEAFPSYPNLSISGPEDLDAVRRVVEQSGATQVLSVQLVEVKQETRVTGGGYYGPVGFYGYYPHARSAAYYSPPDVRVQKTFTTETRLFDLKSDKMVWSATMETSEPDDFTKVASQYADLAVKQMQDNKLIGGR